MHRLLLPLLALLCSCAPLPAPAAPEYPVSRLHLKGDADAEGHNILNLPTDAFALSNGLATAGALSAEASSRASGDAVLRDAVLGVAADLASEAAARQSGDAATLAAATNYADAALAALVPPAPDLAGYATTGDLARAIAAIEIPEVHVPAAWPASAITNAPWLSAYTETDPTVPAWAKESTPPTIVETDPVFAQWAATNTLDLSAYATTGYVASLHPPFEEYASATYTRVAAEAVPASSAIVDLGDTLATVGRTSGYALRALRSAASPEGMESEADVPGSWRLVAPTPAASLSSNVLYATSTPGDATVEFLAAEPGVPAMRAVVSMPGDSVREATVWPAWEVTGTWRTPEIDIGLWDGPATVSTSRWNNADYICTNVAASATLAPAWYATRPPGSAGGMMGVAPHYTLTANHCADAGPISWPGGATTGRGIRVAVWGDLRLQRMTSEVPAACRAKFLRSSVLASLSDSLLFRSLCFAHTQHGGCVPCLVDPRPSRPDLSGLTWDGGWTYVGARDDWLNGDWEPLRRLSHAAHTGDSGHPVFFRKGSAAIPIGLFHWASGSGECLLSDALLDKIDAAIRRDSGGAESLSFFTSEDLQ